MKAVSPPVAVCPPITRVTARSFPDPAGALAVIWVFAMDTVASVKSTCVPVAASVVSFKLVISAVPTGPKFVPVMVTVPPAVLL